MKSNQKETRSKDPDGEQSIAQLVTHEVVADRNSCEVIYTKNISYICLLDGGAAHELDERYQSTFDTIEIRKEPRIIAMVQSQLTLDVSFTLCDIGEDQ